MAAPYAVPAPYAVHTPVHVAPVAHAVHAVEVAAPVMQYAAVAHQPAQLTYAMPEPVVAQPLHVAHAPVMNYAAAPVMNYAAGHVMTYGAAPAGVAVAGSLPCLTV